MESRGMIASAVTDIWRIKVRHHPVHILGLLVHAPTELQGQRNDKGEKGEKAGQSQAFPKLPSETIEQAAYVATASAGRIQKEQSIAC